MAPGTIMPMLGDKHWVVYSVLLAIVGISHLVSSNTRRTAP